MTTTCEFYFDKSDETYHPGERVKVSVVLTAHKVETVKGVYLKLTGDAEANWIENKKAGTTDIQFHGAENYFSEIVYLIGSENGRTISLQQGVYKEELSVIIPADVPETVSSPQGNISYKAVLFLIRPGQVEQQFFKEFKVVNELDLNMCGLAIRGPSEASINRDFCFCCCVSPPMLIDVRIPKTGYVHGETIVLKVMVNNGSWQKIRSLTFELQKIVILNSATPHRNMLVEEIEIVTVDAGEIGRGKRKDFEQSIVIPKEVGVSQNISSVIHVRFGLKIKADVGDLQFSPPEFIPLTIGTKTWEDGPKEYSRDWRYGDIQTKKEQYVYNS